MMNSYRRSKYTFSRTQKSAGGLLAFTLIVLVLGLGDFLSGGAVRAAVRPALVPFANFGKASVAAVSTGDFWSSRRALLEENARLRAERDELLAGGASITTLRAEIDSLSEMARVAGREDVEGSVGITARVVSSFHASPYGTFLIDAGIVDGIDEGDIVLSEDGFVIGRVSDVSEASAVVRMFFAPGETLDVVSGTVGFSISGRGGGNASAQVPREAPLEESDPVFAPTLGQRPVGVIGKVASSSASAYADVYIVFPQNLNTVRHVYVVPGL